MKPKQYIDLSEFHFRESDAKCIFVQTCPRNERSKILRNVTDKPEFKNMPKVVVEDNKEQVYIEQYDIHSKYERKPKDTLPALKMLSFSQIGKIYSPFWGKKP